MRTILKSDFLWKFLGGFAIGAVGLAGVHLAEAAPAPADMAAPVSSAE
ncbi:MAG TPA: hypothetical protein VM657_14980 [Sphingomonas sp.]|nr:hypothetical protein [Sphingomonas sp.]